MSEMNFSVVQTLVFYWILTRTDAESDSAQNHNRPAAQTRLIAMGQGLNTIPEGSFTIKSANFAYNHISELNSYIFYSKLYKNVQKIELYQNKICNISHLAFRELRLLKTVDLSGNKIVTLDVNVFKRNANLKKLDLSNNEINFKSSEYFLHSISLETLVLSDNKIEHIFDETFVRLRNLKNLMMDNNVIWTMSNSCFKPLINLQYLSLAHTGVFKLSDSMFSAPPRIIDLSETPLANKFEPALRKIKGNTVAKLLNVDKYILEKYDEDAV